MRIRLFSFLPIFCFVFLSIPQVGMAEEPAQHDTAQLPSFNIGIVTDGPYAYKPDLVAVFTQEIRLMAEGEFLVDFPESMVLEGDSTPGGINRHLDMLLNNPDVDLVLALGTLASTEALKKTDLMKPVVAPFVFDTRLQKAPKDQVGSGVNNLFYLNLGTPLDQELITFRKLVPFKKLGLLLDERDVNGVPAIAKLSKSLGFEHSIDIHLIPVGNSADAAIAQIPEKTKAVMVGPLWQIAPEELKVLSDRLIDKKVAAFAMTNFEYAEMGFFATTMPEGALGQLARQVAINIQEIMLGENPGTLPVVFAKSQKLSINMATARAIGIYPSLDYMTGANLLNEQRDDIERRVTLPQVVDEALAANLDLAAAEREVLAGSYAVGEAKSALLPQIFIGTAGRTIDGDRARLAQGTTPEKAWIGNLSASQQIYSESRWAGYSVEKNLQTGRESSRDTVRLNIIYEASTAYLDVLRRKTIEQLQKDNMQLTQSNLERAQIRLSTGVAGPDELYRWQTKYANDRQVVLRAESATMDSMQGLNRILNRPLLEEFIAEETDLSDPLLIGGNRLFYQLIHNPFYFGKFNAFAVQAGLDASPELKVLDAAIAAQERLIVKSRREYWAPTISLEANVDYLFSGSGEGQRNEDLTGLDDTDWQVGVVAQLPLIEGGRKGATLGRNQEQLLQLKTERQGTAERISQRVLQSLNSTRASYPSINLSRDAVDAARRNLLLVSDSYVQGIRSIIDLLDAQNQALNAELDAANAVYNFLIDFMGVQRSIGEFFTFMPSEDREVWIEQVKDYMQVTQTQ
ncbi:MAG: TolC family protein [Desulforhopalus sp.]